MVHTYPASEEGLHELSGTMCPCGCELKVPDGAEMIVVHTAFDCQGILVAAENIKNGHKAPVTQRK